MAEFSGTPTGEQRRFAVVASRFNHEIVEKLVVIAPPKILGNLRKAFHAEVAERVAAEIPKELTSHPIAEIERLVAA